MPISHSKAGKKLRQEIASVAARFVAVDGINDLHSAKKKAAMQLGVNPERNLPTNREVEQALINYQSIFLQEQQDKTVKDMRYSALMAMRFLLDFSPKLVGPVLKGTATRYSDITLHIFTDHIEQVGFKLDDSAIPYETFEKTIRINNNEYLPLPAYKFIADQYAISLIVFTKKQKNLSPVSSSSGKSMKRASLKQLESICSDNN